MKNKRPYLLILDPEESILNLQEATLQGICGEKIYSFLSKSEGLQCLKEHGLPDLLIVDEKFLSSDSELVPFLLADDFNIPVIVTANAPVEKYIKSKLSYATAVVEKPLNLQAFTQLIRGLTNSSLPVSTHVPVNISLIQKIGMGYFDLYLKLSETNFVKILHKGEPFLDRDSQKLKDKGVLELYIKKEDSAEFLRMLENQIQRQDSSGVEDITLSLQNLEAFERIAKRMGWTPEVFLSAQRNVANAVAILTKQPNILGTLKKRLRDKDSAYARHLGLLTYLVCAFSSSLGWIGESGQVKLALAALLHDVAVDDTYYENIKEWNKKAANGEDKSVETIKYRMHPFDAAKLVRSLNSISPDVEQIILQHHEVKNGSGFPRGIDSSRIGHLPALFIMVEDLVDFIDDGDNIETSITDFITWGREFYNMGHFKKVFSVFEEKLKN